MTLLSGSALLAGPKHSTSVPSIAGIAVPLSVDEKDGPLVPNPLPVLAVKVSLGPQLVEFDLCTRTHSLLLFILQTVNPFIPPLTVQLKVKVPPGQIGGAAANCPTTSPGGKYSHTRKAVAGKYPISHPGSG